MKLKRLEIKKYKNLIDFSADFESGKGLSILIGNNGSGKSNVLEAISGIFVNAYSAKAIHKFVYSLTYVPYKIGKLQIQGFSEPTTPNKIKQSYHITQKAARSRPRAAFLRGRLGRRQDFSKK